MFSGKGFIKENTDPNSKSKEKKSFWNEVEDLKEKKDKKGEEENKIDIKKLQKLFMEIEVLDKVF